MILRVCFVLMALTVSSQSYAARFSGEYLLRVCSLDERGQETIKGGKIACQAYISGVIDYHNMLKATDFPVTFKFCIPQRATLNTIQQGVWLYMKSREKLHRKFLAAPGVAMALLHLYPCKK